MSKKLERISTETANKLCSGQVVVDLGAVIKELLENSLDAGCTFVEIKLKNYGLDGITVTDDGFGIEDSEFDKLCKKNWTSKINTFEDLGKLKTFGFRGEALSSLCSVADISVTSSTKNSEPKGITVEYDNKGEIKSKKSAARTHGASFKVSNLFKGNIELALRVLKTNSFIERIGAIFGRTAKNNMCTIDENTNNQLKDSETKFSIKGFISSPMPNCGRASSDKQYIYLNGKPCDVPKIKKVINEVYREFNPTQFPLAAICLSLQQIDSVDFNVSPDKRSVFLKYDQELADYIYNVLKETFIPHHAKLSISQKKEIDFKQIFAPKEDLSQLQSLTSNNSNTTNNNVDSSHASNTANNNVASNAKHNILLNQEQEQEHIIPSISKKNTLNELYTGPVKRNKINPYNSNDSEILNCTNKRENEYSSKQLTLSLPQEKKNSSEIALINTAMDLDVISHNKNEKTGIKNSKDVVEKSGCLSKHGPMTLELSIADETAAFEHKDILSKNGFVIKENPDANPGSRVQLLSQPFIEKSLFTVTDLKDLLYNLNENPSETARCKRARDVFASRACRKSIMIGTPLSKQQMSLVVKNLSGLEHPWNCPHGRPTLRHLAKLSDLESTEKSNFGIKNKKPFTWSGTLFS
ncbi:hypothetical protein BB561_002829 [Smittium simulii]|uniref:DNA mismatch repair protein S5 domain-containing protein n=1 Tax=Smittium simulii TaxID=133385 RepID=A0A2T9YNX1_9FUNG|nr:hypothetical protein BB561_002829 [Smittium simulii]